MSLAVAVFSYNRADHLRNCLGSLRRHIPFAEVTVYDDRSDDPATVACLTALTERVVVPPGGPESRHGGLYANMQRALEDCRAEHLVFLQDDMQVVRSVDDADLAVLEALFAADDRRAFVSPTFIKGLRRRRYRRGLAPDGDARCYVARDAATPLAYFDVSIAAVDRLRASSWRFAPNERENVRQARAMFADMPVMGDPFVFYCPEVPIFRNRGRSLASRLAARVTGEAVKAFRDMTPPEVEAFRARDLARWPVAEDFLQPLDGRVGRPFVYADVGARWWLRGLHRIETTLRRRR